MSTVGINFGSATSGSGFDVASTVSSIMAIQRTPESAWATRTSALQTEDTVLTSLGSNASALSTALGALTSFDGVFSQMQGASSDPNTVALTAVGSTAESGAHTITVQHLASTSQQASSAVGATSTVSGTLTVQAAGASSATTINIAAGSTLGQLAKQINSSSAGVRATVLSDSSGQHLSLTSTTSGSAGDLSIVSNAQDSTGNALSFSVAQTGTDAQYTVDGVSLTSGSNSVANALQGVSVQLLGITAGSGSSGSASASSSVTVQIAPNEPGIVSALQTFVSAYNTLSSALSAQEGKDSSGNAQPLYGSNIISEIQSNLSAAFAYQPSASSGGLSMASLGLSLGLDGTLSLDSGVLSSTLSSNFEGASESFLNTGSFGQNLTAALNGIGAASTGTIAMAKNNNSSEEATLAANKANLESRLTAYSASLTAELTTANQVLQAIPQQLDEINQMFYSISGYKSS